jgi:hypothetical protein
MTQHLFDEDQPSLHTRAAATAVAIDPLAWGRRFVANLCAHDWLIAVYFTVVLTALSLGSGTGRNACIHKVALDVTLFSVGLVLTRGEVLRRGTFWNSLLYRLTVFLAVFLSYFQLRDILPAVSARAIDAQIFSFDMRVFGVEPSLAWDKYVNPITTEWFAFFYFSYFGILLVHVIPFLLAAKNVRLTQQFALGIFIVFCTAHTLYMAVPGFGPYWHLATQFRHDLVGGTFWGWVRETVDAGGAQKDIFPSLHTAAPTFLAIFSFRFRKYMPFKYTWPVVAFFASQIIIATMFLRWHYLVDIFAGITLAITANVVAAKIGPWEEARRSRMGAHPVFTALSFGPATEKR